MSGAPALRLYHGAVVHRRRTPPEYAFRYRVFSLLLDLDRLEEADRRHRLFSHNRFNLLAFHDRDHGPKDGSALRPWIDRQLREAALGTAARVELLCYPRLLGYGFNPLSLWLCYRADGSLLAVLCEVRNTFGEWHGYLLHREGAALPVPVCDQAAKVLHVSPFLPREGHYRFRIRPPGEDYLLGVNWHTGAKPECPALIAVQTGVERPAGDAGLLHAALAVPLMTLKVTVAIHWQALKIWLRGGRFHRKPRPPDTEISR